jgi:hypothetical protein
MVLFPSQKMALFGRKSRTGIYVGLTLLCDGLKYRQVFSGGGWEFSPFFLNEFQVKKKQQPAA